MTAIARSTKTLKIVIMNIILFITGILLFTTDARFGVVKNNPTLSIITQQENHFFYKEQKL
jgi:hypothetical protein